MSESFSYSSNEENYHGPFETREAAIEEAKAEGLKRFWTGRNRPPKVSWYIDADDVIDRIVNQDDFCIDAAEGWPDCTKEQEAELTQMLRDTFDAWMAKHKLEPTFWLVDDVQEHRIEEGEAEIESVGESDQTNGESAWDVLSRHVPPEQEAD